MFEFTDRNNKVNIENMKSHLDYVENYITELQEQIQNLTELVESKDSTISELQKAFDESEKDNLNVRDKLMEVENEVDYMKNGKMNSDREELY